MFYVASIITLNKFLELLWHLTLSLYVTSKIGSDPQGLNQLDISAHVFKYYARFILWHKQGLINMYWKPNLRQFIYGIFSFENFSIITLVIVF